MNRCTTGNDVELGLLEGAHMDAQHPLTALDAEIQSFAATLHRCFRDSSWDVVCYYAANAWQASDRAGARWPEVKVRVRTAWESSA